VFAELQDAIERAWRGGWPLLPWAAPRRPARPAELAFPWAPTVDVYEQDGDLVVKAELPGVEKGDIDVSLDRGDLVIRGERKAEKEVKEDNYYRMERSYGAFYRRIPLGFEIQPEQVSARFADGVLEIRVPKPAEPRPQQVKLA
jgi:HSP20 family protein